MVKIYEAIGQKDMVFLHMQGLLKNDHVPSIAKIFRDKRYASGSLQIVLYLDDAYVFDSSYALKYIEEEKKFGVYDKVTMDLIQLEGYAKMVFKTYLYFSKSRNSMRVNFHKHLQEFLDVKKINYPTDFTLLQTID
jgi:hypothetical protein